METGEGMFSSFSALFHVRTVVAAVDWLHSLATAESGQMMLQKHKSVSLLVPMGIQLKPVTLL